MADGYSRLFSQGLMFAGHGSERPAPTTGALLAPPTIIEPVHSSSRTGQIHRRRRSSVTIESSTSPISLLRSPSRVAAHALSRLLRSPSRGVHSHDNHARLAQLTTHPAKLERPRLVFLPPRAKPVPTTPVPLPPASPAPSAMSTHSFLTLERTPSPPPREPLAPHNRDTLSYAATVLPHVGEARNLSAAELHNTLVAPFAADNSPLARGRRDTRQRPSFEYADHPYRTAAPCGSSFLAIDGEDEDELSMQED